MADQRPVKTIPEMSEKTEFEDADLVIAYDDALQVEQKSTFGTLKEQIATKGPVVKSVASIPDLPPVVIGNKISVTGYYSGTEVGGGSMVGKVARHNGITNFDPDRVAEIGTAAYYVDSGADADCWVRTNISNGSSELGGGPMTIYVSPSGDDSRNGVSSAGAFATLQRAFDFLLEFGPFLAGTWSISLAAGTYTSGAVMNSRLRPDFPIVISGPDVGGHPNVPTAIIDGSLDPSSEGVKAVTNNRISLSNVKIQNFTSGNAVENTSGATVSLTNVHTYNCRTALVNLHGSFASVRGGIWDGNNIASSIGYSSFYCATHDFIQASNDAATDALVIKNFDRGMLINEGVQGHVDNVNVLNCTGSGLNIKRGAGAVNTKTMKIDGCAVGVLAENNDWFDNGILYGSISPNTVNVRQLGTSGELAFLVQSNSARSMRNILVSNVGAHTGTVTETTIYQTPSIPDSTVSEGGHYARITIGGTCSLAGNCALKFYINDGTSDDLIGFRNVVAGSAHFKAVLEVWHSGQSSQRANLQITTNTGDVQTINDIGALALKDKAFTFKANAQLANIGDSITLDQVLFEGTY